MFLVGLLFGELLATRRTLEIVVWHDLTSQFEYRPLSSRIPLAAWKAMAVGFPSESVFSWHGGCISFSSLASRCVRQAENSPKFTPDMVFG
jgi:hypothetical protein